jgi:hypothetical protein
VKRPFALVATLVITHIASAVTLTVCLLMLARADYFGPIFGIPVIVGESAIAGAVLAVSMFAWRSQLHRVLRATYAVAGASAAIPVIAMVYGRRSPGYDGPWSPVIEATHQELLVLGVGWCVLQAALCIYAVGLLARADVVAFRESERGPARF